MKKVVGNNEIVSVCIFSLNLMVQWENVFLIHVFEKLNGKFFMVLEKSTLKVASSGKRKEELEKTIEWVEEEK